MNLQNTADKFSCSGKEVMKQPPRRDRVVYFETVWPSSDKRLRLTNMSVRYDCLSGDAVFVGLGSITFPIREEVYEEFDPKLDPLGIRIEELPVSEYMFKLVSIPGTKLNFRSHQEVISFINSVARVFGYPPSYSLEVTAKREVYTDFQSTKR